MTRRERGLSANPPQRPPRLLTPCLASLCRREREELLSRVAGARLLNAEGSLLEVPATTLEGAQFSLRMCACAPTHQRAPHARSRAQQALARVPGRGAGAVGAPVAVPPPAPSTSRRPRRSRCRSRTRGLTRAAGWCSTPGAPARRCPARRALSAARSARPWREGASLAALVSHVVDSLGSQARAPLDHAWPSAQTASTSSALRSLSLDGSDALAARLQALSSAELARCLASPEEALAPLLCQLAAESEAQAVVRQLRASNAAAAQANLELAEEAAGLRAQVAIVRSTDFEAARRAYCEAVEEAAALREKCGTPALRAALAERARADEAEGEALEARLAAGEVGVEAFVRAYKAARARFHLREMKRAAAAHIP